MKTVNVSDGSSGDFVDEAHKARAGSQKRLIEELKAQWKLLWSECYNDRVRAEGVSANDYAVLDIEKGTIIHATKDFKILNFKQIIEKYKIENPDRYIQPDVRVGGWNRFIKTEIQGKTRKGCRIAADINDKSAKKSSRQHSRKGGRGWLNAN